MAAVKTISVGPEGDYRTIAAALGGQVIDLGGGGSRELNIFGLAAAAGTTRAAQALSDGEQSTEGGRNGGR